MIEAVEKAEGPCTMISDHEGILRIAQQGGTPHHPEPVGDELYVATAGEGVRFEWRRRGDERSVRGQFVAVKLCTFARIRFFRSSSFTSLARA